MVTFINAETRQLTVEVDRRISGQWYGCGVKPMTRKRAGVFCPESDCTVLSDVLASRVSH